MSFFYDVLNIFDIKDNAKSLTITYVVGKGFMIVGDFKIMTLNESKIIVKSKNELIVFDGENLMIKTMAKGEIVVFGDIFSISHGDKKHE